MCGDAGVALMVDELIQLGNILFAAANGWDRALHQHIRHEFRTQVQPSQIPRRVAVGASGGTVVEGQGLAHLE